jgi:hypothetical protein
MKHKCNPQHKRIYVFETLLKIRNVYALVKIKSKFV